MGNAKQATHVLRRSIIIGPATSHGVRMGADMPDQAPRWRACRRATDQWWTSMWPRARYRLTETAAWSAGASGSPVPRCRQPPSCGPGTSAARMRPRRGCRTSLLFFSPRTLFGGSVGSHTVRSVSTFSLHHLAERRLHGVKTRHSGRGGARIFSGCGRKGARGTRAEAAGDAMGAPSLTLCPNSTRPRI